MSEFPFYIIEKQFLYNRISFPKVKKSQLCHKRKLPGLIKFRKRNENNNNNHHHHHHHTYRTEQYTQVKYAVSRLEEKLEEKRKNLLTLNTGRGGGAYYQGRPLVSSQWECRAFPETEIIQK